MLSLHNRVVLVAFVFGILLVTIWPSFRLEVSRTSRMGDPVSLFVSWRSQFWFSDRKPSVLTEMFLSFLLFSSYIHMLWYYLTALHLLFLPQHFSFIHSALYNIYNRNLVRLLSLHWSVTVCMTSSHKWKDLKEHGSSQFWNLVIKTGIDVTPV